MWCRVRVDIAVGILVDVYHHADILPGRSLHAINNSATRQSALSSGWGLATDGLAPTPPSGGISAFCAAAPIESWAVDAATRVLSAPAERQAFLSFAHAQRRPRRWRWSSDIFRRIHMVKTRLITCMLWVKLASHLPGWDELRSQLHLTKPRRSVHDHAPPGGSTTAHFLSTQAYPGDWYCQRGGIWYRGCGNDLRH